MLLALELWGVLWRGWKEVPHLVCWSCTWGALPALLTQALYCKFYGDGAGQTEGVSAGLGKECYKPA